MPPVRRDPPASPGTETTQTVASLPSPLPLHVIVSLKGDVRTAPLPAKARILVGRGPDCDLVIQHASVSRHHAALHVSGGTWVEDLGSRNGTRVHGSRVEQNVRVPIHQGTVLEVGSAMLVIVGTGAGLEKGTLPRADASRAPLIVDPAMQSLYTLLDVVAPSSLSILVLGETGVGKEVFARTVHERSKRASKPFAPLSCAALPETLLESELFGYERGAFTGAVQSKPGLFEVADGGTLFLDEIGELAPATQAKLLRVLETGEVMRLGSVRRRHVDVRLVSATHRDLYAMTADGGFRSDLLFRINGFVMTIPPLRERPADIVPLAEAFARRAAGEAGVRVPALSPEAARALEAHPWPGNVRELRNVVESAVTLCRGGPSIEPLHLRLHPAGAARPASTRPPAGAALRASVAQHERDQILLALQKNGGNQTLAAKELGVSRGALIAKIARYGIERPRKKS